MNSNDGDNVASVLLSMLVGVCMLTFIALYMQGVELNNLKAEAVRRGHAEFHLADDQAFPAWRWKETPEAKP
jgi:hypothetical protein